MKESNIVKTKPKPVKPCVDCGAPCLDHWNRCKACWEAKFGWPRKGQKTRSTG